MLQSLVITFEGQSETVTAETGYSASRLCTINQELVCEPAELSAETSEDTDGPSVWNVVFNLTIPGWHGKMPDSIRAKMENRPPNSGNGGQGAKAPSGGNGDGHRGGNRARQ